MLIKRFLSYTIHDNMSNNGSAQDFMYAIGENFKVWKKGEWKKVELTNVMSSFMNIKYDNVDGVRFYSDERFRFLRGLMNSRFLLQ